jgi:hypothetical protein
VLKKTKEFIAGSCSVVFSIFLFLNTFNIKSIGFSRIGPDFVPKILAVGAFLLGVSMMATGFRGFLLELAQWRAQRVGGSKIVGVWDFCQKYKLAVTMLLMLVYFLGVQYFGFLVASIPYLAAQILLLIGQVDKKAFLKVVAVSVGISAIIYVAFVYGFNMILPRGVLFS